MGVLEFDETVEFEGFRLDRRLGILSRRDETGQTAPVVIGSRASEILQILIDHQGDLVPKQTIMDRVWPNTVVEDSNLTTQISALRRLLDRDRAGTSCIQTTPGRGYRFVPRVRRAGSVALSRGTPASQRLDGETSGPLPASVVNPASPDPRNTSMIRRFAAVAGVVAVVLLGCLGVLIARHAGAPANAPPRLSLAVLPFQNIGDDKNDDYLANGITEDLRSDLSHIPVSTVVGSAAANRYAATEVAPNRIGQELNVRYLIEGSIRRIDAIIRVNVKLVTADTGKTLWADRFDEDLATIAAGQDRIVGRLRAGLGIGLVDVESVRSLRESPTAPDAVDLVLRARALLNQPTNEQRSNEALMLYERALA